MPSTVVAVEPAVEVTSPVSAGIWVAPMLPDKSLNEGCESRGTPDVLMVLTHSCATGATASTPPIVVVVGVASEIVPVVLIGPPARPVPVPTLVTVPPEPVAEAMIDHTPELY